jgi:WD40 repeat protein
MTCGASTLNWAVAVGVAVGMSPVATAAEPTYWQDVRPVLRKHCTFCHSAKNLAEADVSGGLALDSYDVLRNSPKKGLLHSGKADGSLLVKVLTTTDDEKRMPLGSPALPAEAVEVLRRWIDAGTPEGKRPAETQYAAPAKRTSPARSRDLVVPLTASAPKGAAPTGVTGRMELAVRTTPLAPVTAVAFSPDGRMLAVGSYGRVTLWDWARIAVTTAVTNVLGAVHDLRFSPDGKLLAAAGGQPSARGEVRLYRTADWKSLATLGGHADVVAGVSFHPDGKRLATASYDKTVRVWDLATAKPVRELTGHSDFVYGVAFSPDGKLLVSCSKDRTVRVVEADTGKGRLTLSGMDQDVLTVAFSPDGKHVVSSGLEPGLSWWDVPTGKRLRVQNGHGVGVNEVCFSRDGKLAASAASDRTVRLWDGATGNSLRPLTTNSIAYAVALSPDGRRVVAGCFDGLARVWDTASGRPVLTLLGGDGGEWLAVTPDGFVNGSPALLKSGRWRVAGKEVNADAVLKALHQPEQLARAVGAAANSGKK